MSESPTLNLGGFGLPLWGSHHPQSKDLLAQRAQEEIAVAMAW